MLTGQLRLAVVPASSTVFGGGLLLWSPLSRWRRRRREVIVWVSAVANSYNNQNHYAILGVSPCASSNDIKKAYRLLARKWHPDVSKDSRAGEVFKCIHLAYQVLSNEATRFQYDRVLKSARMSIRKKTSNISQFEDEDEDEDEDEMIMHKWSELRKKIQYNRLHRQRQYHGGEKFSSHLDSEGEEEAEDKADEERGSFLEVLRCAFVSIFLMQTVGCQISLMLSTITAWCDGKLDGGYKLGYLIAWMLGGRGGVLLSLCLSFASWVCGKNSSSIVTVVVVAMWVGSNVLSYAPLPQGALLALLYMSVKLQVDLS